MSKQTTERQITVGDLRRMAGKIGKLRAMLLCPVCGEQNSADASDYFIADAHSVLECCDTPMRLVTKRTVYENVEI